ncbi:hypothetical protein, partial [Staphylococcus epidermidis]|uniref:hypothetical protein n=1 Tax=Staphylococcus epidermidis TaxID=1282 RepID=UPI0037D9B0F1
MHIHKQIPPLQKQLHKLQTHLHTLHKNLSNHNFLNKPPQKIINQEKQKQQHYQQKYNALKSTI